MPTLLAVGFVLVGLYFLSCRVWPNARCRPCSGTGRGAGSNRKRWNNCGTCGGSGRRLRLGARLFFRKH